MLQNNKLNHSEMIKAEAKRIGFAACGISQANFLHEDALHLNNWLKQGKHGQMHYMENHFEKRVDPRLLVEGARSVISVLLNYYTKETQKDKDAPKISKYAYGKDYHFVLKDKLKKLLKFIKKNISAVNGHVFVDTAPVLEKSLVKNAGLGWIGKSSILISKEFGSFIFIGELIIDLELEYDQPIKDFCGTCTRCIDDCPTNAIVKPYIVDGSKCISFFTIELKGKIPPEMKGKFNNWIFGCDICQNVCPWNKNAVPHNESSFDPPVELINMTKDEWYEITEDRYKKIFKNSAVKRTTFKGLKRNLEFLHCIFCVLLTSLLLIL